MGLLYAGHNTLDERRMALGIYIGKHIDYINSIISFIVLGFA